MQRSASAFAPIRCIHPRTVQLTAWRSRNLAALVLASLASNWQPLTDHGVQASAQGSRGRGGGGADGAGSQNQGGPGSRAFVPDKTTGIMILNQLQEKYDEQIQLLDRDTVEKETNARHALRQTRDVKANRLSAEFQHQRSVLMGRYKLSDSDLRAHETAEEERCVLPSSVQGRLQAAKVFCFDVDSTVITTEGIDELADTCGVKAQVERLTADAMGGSIPFHASLRARLDIMQPRRQQIEELHATTPFVLSDHISDLIDTLHSRGVTVYLLSGGFQQMIAPIAERLGISSDQVYANELRFKPDGSFLDFNPQAWTSTAGGKKRVIEHLRTLHSSASGRRPVIVMVGDGATDLEARDADDGLGGADVMVGYGGNVVREKVEREADWFVRDFRELAAALKPSASA